MERTSTGGAAAARPVNVWSSSGKFSTKTIEYTKISLQHTSANLKLGKSQHSPLSLDPKP